MIKKMVASLKEKMFLFVFLKGVDCLDKRKYIKAIRIFDQLIKNYKDTPELYYNKGGAHFRLGKFFKENKKTEKAFQEFQKALEAFDKYIELEPENVEVYFGKGLVYSTLEEFPEAIKNYEKVLNIMPYYINALYQLTNALILTEQYDKALAVIKHILTHCSDNTGLGAMFKHWLKLLIDVPQNETVEEIRHIITEIPEMLEL
jgi:tetratricopeptide (TPR) repeat protein